MPNTDAERIATLAALALHESLCADDDCDGSDMGSYEQDVAHVAAVLVEAGVGFVADVERRCRAASSYADGHMQVILDIERMRDRAVLRAERAEAALAEQTERAEWAVEKGIRWRDKHDALRERVQALADEWGRKHAEHISAATVAASELEAALQVSAGSVRKLCADDLRALLDEGDNQ